MDVSLVIAWLVYFLMILSLIAWVGRIAAVIINELKPVMGRLRRIRPLRRVELA